MNIGIQRGKKLFYIRDQITFCIARACRSCALIIKPNTVIIGVPVWIIIKNNIFILFDKYSDCVSQTTSLAYIRGNVIST